MSEEQANFKITDRRLFNADGTPREGAREEAPQIDASAAVAAPEVGGAVQPNADDSATASPSASASGQEAQRSAGAHSSSAQASGAQPARSPAEQDELPEDSYAEADIPGANDPASFVNFIMSIASNAAASLGMMEHPVTGEREVDLQLAKHWIDIIGMLQQKTRGNLAPQENQIVEGLLADLRMQYVSLSGGPRPPSAPPGFTGRDITGGR